MPEFLPTNRPQIPTNIFAFWALPTNTHKYLLFAHAFSGKLFSINIVYQIIKYLLALWALWGGKNISTNKTKKFLS
jgi:hypothetical protein